MGIIKIYKPKGKTTHSWPNHMRQIPINIGDINYRPLYPYKHGLTQFPASDSSSHLKVYACTTNNEGDTLLVYFNDKITSNYSTIKDYNLFINGELTNTYVKSQAIDSNNATILKINLSTPIQQGDELYLNIANGVLASNSMLLSDTRQIFVYNGVKNYNLLSNRIEAESYYEMQGVNTEQCSDDGGGHNLGHIDIGDYMKYNFNVPKAGYYQLVSRIAGFNDGSIDFRFKNTSWWKAEWC